MALRILGLFIILAVCSAARAQSDFVVPVNSATTGRGIAGAFVRLTCLSGGCGASTYSQTTDTSGNAQFTGVIAGKYTITISGQQITSYSYTRDVTAANPSNLNNIIFVDGVTYPCSDIGLTNAITAAPSTGAMIVVNCGPLVFANTVVINKSVYILIGAVSITGPTSIGSQCGGSGGCLLDIESQGVHIEGLSQSLGSSTVYSSLNASQNSHAIYIGKGIIQWHIEHLQIRDAYGSGRSAGAGIYADAGASPALNQRGTISDVYVSGMYNGANLQRPINTSLSDFSAFDSKQDGLIVNGDGTTVICTNCYLNNNTGRGAHFTWITGISFQGGEISGNGGVGLQVDANSSNISSNLNVLGTDFEANTGGGVLTQDVQGQTFFATFLSNGGDSIRASGGSGCFGQAYVRNSGAYGFNAGVTSPLSNVLVDCTLESLGNWSGNTSGNVNDPNSVVSVISATSAATNPARLGVLSLRTALYGSANILLSTTAPTIASGFGTSPSIVQQNGTAAFTINVGTSNTGTGVVTMPTAAHGWSCTATDTTTTSTTVSQTKVVPTSVTSVTFQNYTDISGTHAWVDSDVLAANCYAY